MPIRPTDVRRKEFKSGFRGYDANQVDDFLDAVADEFERTYTENQRMREEVTSLRERLQQFEDLEDSIRAALVHAERASNDVRLSAAQEADDRRRSAEREAEITIQDAQTRSRRMLADASARVERVQESYEALQEAKRGFSNDFRSLLKTYMDVMENMDVNTAKEIDASLRNRLDTEAIAVAREAAREEEEEAGALQGAGGTDAGRTLSGHSILAPAEMDGAQTVGPQAEATEPEATEPEAAGPEFETNGEERTPVADDLGAADGRSAVEESSVSDDAATQVPEPVPAGETQASTGPDYSEPEPVEPEEVEPSTAQGRSAEDAAVSEPGAAEEVEWEEPAFAEEPALAEESRSQEFFDREEGSSRGSGDGRIFRASRFLRRRG